MIPNILVGLLAVALGVSATPLSLPHKRHLPEICIKDELFNHMRNKYAVEANAYCRTTTTKTVEIVKTPTVTVTKGPAVTQFGKPITKTIVVTKTSTCTRDVAVTETQTSFTTIMATENKINTVTVDTIVTDATAINTLTDLETYTTDVTLVLTETDLVSFTTTVATVTTVQTVTQTATLTDTETDTPLVLVTQTATATVTAVAPAKRAVTPSPNDPFMASNLKTTSSADIRARDDFRGLIGLYDTDCRHRACSCLNAKPMTIYKTNTCIAQATTKTVHPTVTKPWSTRYITLTYTRIVGIRESQVHTKVVTHTVHQTDTLTSTETDVATEHATLQESVTITQSIPVPETITQTAIITSSVENDQTATENDTATQVITNTVDVTVTQPTTATITNTATVTVQPAPTTGPCMGLDNPYTAPDGHVYQLACGSFYPISPGGLVGSGTYATYAECVNLCGANAACQGVDYDQGNGLCDLFSSHVSGEGGFDSAIKIS